MEYGIQRVLRHFKKNSKKIAEFNLMGDKQEVYLSPSGRIAKFLEFCEAWAVTDDNGDIEAAPESNIISTHGFSMVGHNIIGIADDINSKENMKKVLLHEFLHCAFKNGDIASEESAIRTMTAALAEFGVHKTLWKKIVG